MQTFLLSLLFSLLALTSPVSAQTSTTNCSYKTTAVVYKQTKGGQIATLSDVGTLFIANNKQEKPTPLSSNSLAQYTYDGGINFSTSPYKPGSEATVTLTGLDRSKWDIVGEFCDPHSSTQGCPGPKSAVYYRNEPDGIIQGFRVNCGVDITYGWVIKPKSTNSGNTTYRMSVRDTNKSGDACFLSVDSKTGFIKNNSSHCRVASCTPAGSSQITGLVVDYANTTTVPISSLQWQTNVCGQVHGELPGGDKNNCIENSFTDSVTSIEPRTLGPGKTIRCIWLSPSTTNQKPVCRVLTSSDNTNPRAGCSSAALPPVGSTPPEALPTERGPTKTVIPPTTTPLPTPGFIYAIKPEDVEIHWDFTNKITDLVDQRDSQILGLKIGICDDFDSANYNRKTKRLGGKGPLCKWYDTYRTDKPLKRKDTPKGSTQLTGAIDLDFDNNPLDSSKNYYLTCQYYIERNWFLKDTIFHTSYDTWRRCKPRKVEPNKKVVFSNILSPAQHVDNIPEEVPLSEGMNLMLPPQSSSFVIPVEFSFRPAINDPSLNLYGNVRYFRLGICKDLSLAQLENGNKNCVFFDTLEKLPPSPDNTYQALYTTGPDNKPLENGDTYFITCQFKYETALKPNVRRCIPRKVVVHQKYTDIPKSWMLFDAYQNSVVLPETDRGIIPLSLKFSTQKYKSSTQVEYSLCTKDTMSKENCTRKTESLITSADGSLSNSTMLQPIPNTKAENYSLTCNLINQDGSTTPCGTKVIHGTSPVSILASAKSLSITTAAEKCDSNKDGLCNGLDVARCLANKTVALCDLNDDQVVNATDYSLLKSELGKKR